MCQAQQLRMRQPPKPEIANQFGMNLPLITRLHHPSDLPRIIATFAHEPCTSIPRLLMSFSASASSFEIKGFIAIYLHLPFVVFLTLYLLSTKIGKNYRDSFMDVQISAICIFNPLAYFDGSGLKSFVSKHSTPTCAT